MNLFTASHSFKTFSVSSGVLQGSVMGPLVYVNDIPEQVGCS